MSAPLLKVQGLVREHLLPRAGLMSAPPRFRVLHGIDLTLEKGESLGIVGESGCGKSTLARAVMALEVPQAGHVAIHGRNLADLTRRELRAARRHFQIIFQDPYGSLDPRHKVGRIVLEPLAALEPETGRTERCRRLDEVLEAVGLPASAADKYPHEFSGGQRQRIAIARALVTRPDLIVADEPVSALDVSVQAQVLNLMLDLQERLGLAYLFISHDLRVVRAITGRVAIMYLGRIVEEGPTAAIFASPAHPYTRMLLDAVPRADHAGGPRTRRPAGEAVQVNPVSPPPGCPFAPRCPLAEDRCRAILPELRPVGPGRQAACHLA